MSFFELSSGLRLAMISAANWRNTSVPLDSRR